MRNSRTWIRLAIGLSLLWLVGIGVYTAYAWFNARNVDSPFVYYVIASNGHDGGYFRVNRTYSDPTAARPQPRFKQGHFLMVLGGVLGGIWACTVIPLWATSASQGRAGTDASSRSS